MTKDQFRENNMKHLLLHCCCAPCAGGCIRHPFVIDADLKPEILYFSNSNIDSEAEYLRRLECVLKLGEYFNIPVEADPYDHEAWLKAVRGFEDQPEGGSRCEKCFAYSLARAAAAAEKHQCCFATTLTVSPRKSSKKIFECAKIWNHFMPLDFKKKNGYLTGTRLAAELGFYRQNYCGCEFSKTASEDRSSITPPPQRKPSES